MRGYLLDTNAALIALTEPERLSPRVRKAVLAAPIFERGVLLGGVLKSMKGTLSIADPEISWS